MEPDPGIIKKKQVHCSARNVWKMKREQGTAMRECMCASPTWTEQHHEEVCHMLPLLNPTHECPML